MVLMSGGREERTNKWNRKNIGTCLCSMCRYYEFYRQPCISCNQHCLLVAAPLPERESASACRRTKSHETRGRFRSIVDDLGKHAGTCTGTFPIPSIRFGAVSYRRQQFGLQGDHVHAHGSADVPEGCSFASGNQIAAAACA